MAPSSPAPETAAPTSLRGLEYEDLRLLIEGAAGEYKASVVESPAGECSAPETIHWQAPTGHLQKERDVRRAGAALFDTFLTGQIRELYRESVALTGAKQKGLRVKLLIDPPELCGAPWELLWDERSRRYLALSSKTPIIRHPRIPQAVAPLIVHPPLRILGLIANPIDPNLPSLDVDKERALIETALADASKAGLVELQWLPGRTWEDLQQAMWQKDGWHVFHFCGHGDYDRQAGEGYVVFETARAGAHRLAASQLGLLLKEQGNVRLAILNSCKGAVGDTSATSSSVAGALMRAGLGGVVSMQNPISDQAALTFARVTYLGIAAGLPLEAAIGSARVAMTLEHAKPVEWWTPVLHMRSSEGALFDLPAPASTADGQSTIRGMEYLGPDIDRRLEQELARRRWQRRLLYSFILAPIPVLGFLAATSVQSAVIRADIEASGATFVLSAEREWFGELPRLESFTAAGFDRLLSPGFAFPQAPPPHQDAVVTAEAVDTGSWISLQPWKLPVGARVTWDHPRSARVGEYAESLAVGANQRFHVGLVHRIRLSRFGSAPAVHDYADTSALELVSSSRPLGLELRFRRLTDMTVPHLSVDSLTLQRQGYGDDGPIIEPTLLSARIHFAGRDTLLETTHLALNGLADAGMDRFRLIDRGIAFSLTGSVQQITIGESALALPSRLQSLIRERPLHLVVGVLAYVLILLTALLSWRTSYASRTTAS